MLKSLAVAACGLLASLLTAALIVLVAHFTGFNFFTFSLWFVVPAGALIAGFAAASGYYLGSLALHKRARWPLLVQMVVIAGLTQGLIYYGEYATDTMNDGTPVAGVVGFWDYLRIALTSAHYRYRGSLDVGEVGRLGYGLAALHFVGFLVGGACVYLLLQAKPVCQACGLYFRRLARNKKIFPDAQAAQAYHAALAGSPVGSAPFNHLLASTPHAESVKGAVRVDTALLGCPRCHAQRIEEETEAHNGKDWQRVPKLDRQIGVPAGSDLRPVFAQTAK